MHEEELRQQAVRRYLSGEKVAHILNDVDRSRPWLRKWVARFQTGAEDWYVSDSRAPKRVANRTPRDIEALVIKARDDLLNTKYAQIGANAIKWHLHSLGLSKDELPEIWTINRILKRHGLQAKRKRYEPKGTPYPKLDAPLPNDLHQADMVGPRYLKGGFRFYGLNVLDYATRRVAVNITQSKHDNVLAESFFASWRRLGSPRLLQLDNQAALRGANRYPRSFGLIVRCCLNLGITPVFIPVSEPWRNPEIERFNDVWDKTFYRTQCFDSLETLRAESISFETFHNEHHRYSALSGKTPNQALQASGCSIQPLHVTSLPKEPPSTGTIKLIRFIRNDAMLDIFTERFLLDRSVVYEYVTATIYVKEQVLIVDCQGHEVAVIDYKLPWM